MLTNIHEGDPCVATRASELLLESGSSSQILGDEGTDR